MARIKKTKSKAAMNRLIVNLEVKQGRLAEPDWKVADEKTLGAAYQFFHNYYDPEDALQFLVTYLKSVKFPKKDLASIQRAGKNDLISVGTSLGWYARLLIKGAKLPDETKKRFSRLLFALVDRMATKAEVVSTEPAGPTIQDRIKNRADVVIAQLEEAIDAFTRKGVEFDATAFVRKNEISPPVAKFVVDALTPSYGELVEVATSKDPQLNEAYAFLSKVALKKRVAFQKGIIDAFLPSSPAIAAKKVKKPRVKKAKTAAELVSKIKIGTVFGKFKSVPLAKIVGAEQVWVFNTKNRTLGVYRSESPNGLSIKGSTLIGYDKTAAIGKRLRKPEDGLQKVLDAGKVALRTLLSEIKAGEKTLSGRLNSDIILVRIM